MILTPGNTGLLFQNPGVQILRPRGNSALYNSLVAFWELDEASGSRSDSIGSSTLTDVNTVTSTTGLVYSLAAQFAFASSEYLSRASDSVTQTGNINFWFAAWVNLTLKTNLRIILSKYRAFTASREYYLLYHNGTDRYEWLTSTNGNTGTTVTANTFGSPTASVWNFVAAYHDADNDLIGISVNGGSFDTIAFAGGVITSVTDFRVGGIDLSNTGANFFMNGLLGPVMMGKGYVPSVADMLVLYNAGVGRTLEAMRSY